MGDEEHWADRLSEVKAKPRGVEWSVMLRSYGGKVLFCLLLVIGCRQAPGWGIIIMSCCQHQYQLLVNSLWENLQDLCKVCELHFSSGHIFTRIGNVWHFAKRLWIYLWHLGHQFSGRQWISDTFQYIYTWEFERYYRQSSVFLVLFCRVRIESSQSIRDNATCLINNYISF